jgi:Ca2+-binding EF-hand superfamily protein
MKTIVSTIAIGAAMFSASALAQAPGGGGFTQRDQSRAEAQQRADMVFQMLDTNKDGSVTRAEADQALAQFQATRGEDNGGRGSGRIQHMLDQAFATSQSLTLQQFEAHSLARFDAQDLNKDGTVTAAEREQVREQRKGQAASAPQAPASKPQ